MFIRKIEYNGLYEKIDRQNERIKQIKAVYEEELKNQRKETQKYKEQVEEDRRIFRNIHKLILKEKQTQNYGSVENALNKLETEISKIEMGE